MPTTTTLCASCEKLEARAPRAEAESLHQPEARAPGSEMALEHRDLGEVTLDVGHDLAVPHRRGAR